MKMMGSTRATDFSKFATFLHKRRQRLDGLLRQYLTSITQGGPKTLRDAMAHIVLSGGKRSRSLLVYAVGEMYHVDLKQLDTSACAIEMIHSFSLVHDDLPAMDNDSLRRGKPTCHLAFDEATAILAGDALAVAAFQILSEAKLPAEIKVKMCQVLAAASGSSGMAGGQYIDLHRFGATVSAKKLEQMYLLKTGALIRAAVRLGALAANIKKRQDLVHLDRFALSVGLAFQIKDDILNIESSANKLGKNIGTDSMQHKITYPALVGVTKAKAKIGRLWKQAEQSLQQLQANDGILRFLTDHIMQRDC